MIKTVLSREVVFIKLLKLIFISSLIILAFYIQLRPGDWASKPDESFQNLMVVRTFSHGNANKQWYPPAMHSRPGNLLPQTLPREPMFAGDLYHFRGLSFAQILLLVRRADVVQATAV